MADTFNDFRAEVLDWLSLSATDTQYDNIIRRAVNNVTARLNHGPLLIELAKQVSLKFNLPDNFNSTLTDNPQFDWYGPTESWTPDDPEQWLLTENAAQRNDQNPVTVNGNPYAGQTGEALNSGSYLSYLIQFELGELITGLYYSQVVDVLPGREYTVEGDILYADNRLNQDKFSPMIEWGVMSVVAPGGEDLTIVSAQDNTSPYTPLTISPDQKYPKITFKVGPTPGKGANELVQVEVRIGFNTDGLVLGIDSALPPPDGPAYWVTSPQFSVKSCNVFLTKGLDADTMVTTATLPDDCRNVISIKLGGRGVRSLDQHKDDPRYRTRLPYYKRDGLQIEFSHALDPEDLPAGLLRYIPDIPKIDGSNQDAEHIGIARWRRTYLFGALCDTCASIPDYEAREMYKADYAQAYAELVADQNRRQKQSSRHLYVRRY